MPRKLLIAGLLWSAFGAIAALGQDAPPAPRVPSPVTPPAGMSQAQLEQFIDLAVRRALAQQSGVAPSPQSAAPQAAVQAPPAVAPVIYVLQAPAAPAAVQAIPQRVPVLVPPGPVRATVGFLGRAAARAGEPCVKNLFVAGQMIGAPVQSAPMTFAPAPYYATPAYQAPIVASPQAMPQLPSKAAPRK
jgi:hypothetical protein